MHTPSRTPSPWPSRPGLAAVFLAMLMLLEPEAVRARGSVRGANMSSGAARAGGSYAAARPAGPGSSASRPATSGGGGPRPPGSVSISAKPPTSAGFAPRPASSARIERRAASSGAAGTGAAAAHGARGAYGSAAVARTRPAGAGAAHAVVPGRGYGGGAWATTLPAGSRPWRHLGRDYYAYGGYYYRRWLYGGVPYYYYSYPPYYTYYDDAPVGAVAIGEEDSSLLYADGSYYQMSYEEGEPAYEVVPAPEGVMLPASLLPAGLPSVTVAGQIYAFYANTFYQSRSGPGGDELVAVSEPAGLIKLGALPADAEPVEGGNDSYFRSGDRYYLPYLDPRGEESFILVDPPSSSAAPATPQAAAPEPALPPVTTLMVRAGTALSARTASGIDGGRVRRGEVFEATLDRDLMAEGRLVAGRGSPVYGSVVETSASLLVLQVTDITIGGRVVPARSEPLRLDADAGPVAAPAGSGGASLGASLDAAVSGTAGAAGTGTAASVGVVLPAGTTIDFRFASTLIVGVAGS